MKKFLAILLLGFSSCYAQTVTAETTTPNLITSGTTHTWTGVSTGAIPSGCGSNGSGGCAGGPGPLYDPATNTIHFSYGQATVGQTIAINNALSSVGAGVKVNGYNYSYDVRNLNGDNRQTSTDTFSITTKMTSNTGATLLTATENYNTKFDWTSFSSSKTATTPYDLTNLGSLSFSVTGMDNGYWGGYFGPQVRNANMSLRYTVDPCAANPAFSTTCANYSTNIITSPNLLTAGSSYAINQALSLTGSGVMIHGFNYGYNYNVGGTVCTAWNQDGSCSWTMNSSLTVINRISDNNGTIIYNQGDVYNTATSGTKDVTYLFPTSKPLTSLGSFSMLYGGSGSYSVTNRYSKAIYTPDWCAQNPAYSVNCPNYNTVVTSDNLLPGTTGPQSYAINTALAFAGAGATIHGFNYGYDYNVSGRSCAVWDIFGFCITGFNYSDAGVTTTLTNSAGVVGYNDTTSHSGGNNGISGSYSKSLRLPSSVPMSTLGTFSMNPYVNGSGSITNMYSRALYTADPCLDPLSSTSCPGYQQAYFTQQCTINALYNSACPGYAQALFTQQCNANQLSDQRCPGYAAAYLVQQCNANPLYSTTCVGYDTAQTECTTNPLSHSYCTNYQTATTECASNPLYGSYCPMYSTASLECSTNPLSHSYCPMYQSATDSCNTNSLTYSYCPGYNTAQTACSTNPLSNSLCTGYQTATTECSTNPLSNSYCPLYQTATTQCAASALYASYCPGYQFAYDCSQDGLYSKQCPNYAEAYAKKYVLNISPTPTATTTTTAETTTTASAGSVSTTGVVATTAESITTQLSSGISDTTVSNTVTQKASTANAEAAPAAPVKLTAQAPTTTQQVAQAEPKKDNSPSEKKEEKKDEGTKSNASNTNSPTGGDSKPSDSPKTARQELAERRREAAQKEAVAKGANLANEMGKAADMEAQKAVQNVVIQAMGFTPGFDTYNKAMLPDSRFYAPKIVYGGQVNVDNKAISRRLMTGSDRLHQEMVDEQYNR